MYGEKSGWSCCFKHDAKLSNERDNQGVVLKILILENIYFMFSAENLMVSTSICNHKWVFIHSIILHSIKYEFFLAQLKIRFFKQRNILETNEVSDMA